MRQIRAHECVTECFYITGDFDYMARITAGSTEELTKVLHDIKQNTAVIPRI